LGGRGVLCVRRARPWLLPGLELGMGGHSLPLYD